MHYDAALFHDLFDVGCQLTVIKKQIRPRASGEACRIGSHRFAVTQHAALQSAQRRQAVDRC